MKILLLWSYYEHYLDYLYAENNDVKDWSYEKQLDSILSDYFGWPPSLVKRMSEHGCDVKIIIVNALPLQKAWATENNCDFDNRTWQYDIPFEQVKRFSPDVIWIGTMLPYFGEYLKELRAYCKKIFAWVAAPIPNDADLSSIDCVLTSHGNFQERFKQKGKNCEILLPAFETRVLDSLSQADRSIECSFVGSLSHLHVHRMQVIRTLANHTPIQLWSDPPKLLSRGLLNPKFVYSYLKNFSYTSIMNPSVWGVQMYEVLAKSQITVNIHVDAASGLAGNIRMFEATGVGALLINENSPNIRKIYEPGLEIVTYQSTSELIEKINYYIEYPREREKIASAGQKKTIGMHSTVQRSQELLQIFNKYLKS